MAMPRLLVLVRHGKSEGNIAKKRSKEGDDTAYKKLEIANRHTSHFRLVDEGRKQAKLSGEWIKENLASIFDRYYVSQYHRAMETAAYLDLPNAEWYTDLNLRERDWGNMDIMDEEERHRQFSKNVRGQSINPLFWRPTNGESIAQVCLRVDRVIATLSRECEGKRVIIVSHGELMWA